MHPFVRDRSVGERVKHSSLHSGSAALCPDPPEIDHGSWVFSGNSVDDSAHYTCELVSAYGRCTLTRFILLHM